MDFILMYTLMGVITCLMLSYDIICQWFRNLQKRIPQFPPSMQIPVRKFLSIKYVIPKFHIYGHGNSCQYRFSLNFLKFSARTNGEEPERWWSYINPVSMSTKEMTPGSRTDVIDDHAAAWNFRKIVGFGMHPIKARSVLFHLMDIVCRFRLANPTDKVDQDECQASGAL